MNETIFSVLKRVTIRSGLVSMLNEEVRFKKIVYNANRLVVCFVESLIGFLLSLL
jgi:hypothetical protein